MSVKLKNGYIYVLNKFCMGSNLMIGLVMVGITVLIQAIGTDIWKRHFFDKYSKLDNNTFRKRVSPILLITSFYLIIINFSQAFLWGVLFYSLPHMANFETLEKAVYFSLVTFTTLGYGDITIAPEYRLLSGIEAINGILLIGWSTTLMFATVQYIVKTTGKKEV